MSNSDKPALIFPILATRRLLLREFSLADVSAVFKILHREDVNQLDVEEKKEKLSNI